MRKFFRLLAFSVFMLCGIMARADNITIIWVNSAPSGSCTNGQPMQYVISTGVLYSCQAGTWGSFGTGSGAVTAVSVATANGVSGTSSGGSTPALTIALGAITPTSTNGVTAATMAYMDATSSVQTQLNARLPLAGGTMTGALITAASTTGGAGLNLPPGTAPSSPNNGDCWTTSAGLYCRIGGSTVGPYGTGSGSGTVNSGTTGQIGYYAASGTAISGTSALPNGTTATTQSSGDTSTDVATNQFVSNALAGINPAIAVLAASTANLTGTYAQVGGGIGDTFTVTATGAFTLDGVAINTIGQRVLLKNQSSANQNGVYSATVVGTTGVSPVFTRATDYDTPSDVNNTGAIPVQSGTANTTTSWLLTSQVTSIGSSGSSLIYAQIPAVTTLTSWGPTGYVSGDGWVMIQNELSCSGFVAPANVSTGHVGIFLTVDDPSNNSSFGIYGITGTLVAKTTATTYSSTGWITPAWSAGTITVPAGRNYFCATSAAGTIRFDYLTNWQTFYQGYTLVVATTGGAMPSSISAPADSGGSEVNGLSFYLLP